MVSPREWVRGTRPSAKIPLGERYPQMVGPAMEILNEMADTPGCVVTVPQIYSYLCAPKSKGGAGLVPGKTVAESETQFRNWIVHAHRELWAMRGGKRGGKS